MGHLPRELARLSHHFCPDALVGADLFIVDERAARREAERRGLEITGTLGVLDRAAERGLIDFGDALKRLRQTTFRMSAALIEDFLERNARRARRVPGEGEGGRDSAADG